MSVKADDIDTLTTEIPAGTSTEPGYDQWVKGELIQAVADLDDPDREEIEHDTVFAKLDGIIAKHEVP